MSAHRRRAASSPKRVRRRSGTLPFPSAVIWLKIHTRTKTLGDLLQKGGKRAEGREREREREREGEAEIGGAGSSDVCHVTRGRGKEGCGPVPPPPHPTRTVCRIYPFSDLLRSSFVADRLRGSDVIIRMYDPVTIRALTRHVVRE
jgi:hypothetical protein